MALWVILGIKGKGATRDPKDQKVIKEGKDSAFLDQEDPQEKRVIQAGRAPEVEEVNVGLKERLETKERPESLVNQVNQVIQEREDLEESRALTESQAQWVILE